MARKTRTLKADPQADGAAGWCYFENREINGGLFGHMFNVLWSGTSWGWQLLEPDGSVTDAEIIYGAYPSSEAAYAAAQRFNPDA